MTSTIARPCVSGARPWLAGAGLLMASQVAAAAGDLPGSDACRTALQALDHAEAALIAASAASAASSAPALAASAADRQRDIAARLYPQRQRVADACLGGLTTSPPPSQRSWMPPALRPEAPPLPPRVHTPARPAEPPARWQAPLSIGSCNAATCVASDGSTLTRVGPLLVGPRGACTQQGVFLSCP